MLTMIADEFGCFVPKLFDLQSSNDLGHYGSQLSRVLTVEFAPEESLQQGMHLQLLVGVEGEEPVFHRSGDEAFGLLRAQEPEHVSASASIEQGKL